MNDPLVYHGWVKVGWGREILTSVAFVWENINKINLPLLFLHGIEDTICPIQFSIPFFEQIPAKDKTFIKYPVMRHEIFQEPDKKVNFIFASLFCPFKLNFVFRLFFLISFLGLIPTSERDTV